MAKSIYRDSSSLKILLGPTGLACTSCCGNPPADEPCPCCFGPATYFGDIPTPRYVKLTLTGTSHGQAWTQELEDFLLPPRILEQDSEDSCTWVLLEDGWQFFWALCHSTVSQIVVVNPGLGISAFHGFTGPRVCFDALENTLPDVPTHVFIDGTGTISFLA